MIKKLHVLVLLLIMGAGTSLHAQRYLTEVFSAAQVTKNVQYGVNISVLTGAPQQDTLYADIYQPPAFDPETERPLVLYIHTGSFLPVPLNGGTTGSKEDSAAVEICTQLAKRGYVVAAITYRLGWNPVSPVQDDRTGTLLNAAYRGIQDGRSCIRWFHKDVATSGNTYGIDTSAIIALGQGTGGYMSFGLASLDKYSELTLSKFLDVNGDPYVDTTLSGDWNGYGGTGLNIENHKGYSSEIDFAVNLGGACGDSSWIEAGDAPTVSFHCPNDPFAPYGFGAVIVPTTGDFVVNVSGSQHSQGFINGFGNNDCFANPAATWTDAYTTRANAVNGGLEGLFPFYRPTPESGPWEWWDTTAANHSNSIQTNPDMSKTKALSYIDTVMNYSNPRIVACLGLDTTTPVGVYDDVLKGYLSVAPNPAQNRMEISLDHKDQTIRHIEVMDLSGRVLRNINGLNTRRYVLHREGLSEGLYLIRVTSQASSTTRKVIFR